MKKLMLLLTLSIFLISFSSAIEQRFENQLTNNSNMSFHVTGLSRGQQFAIGNVGTNATINVTKLQLSLADAGATGTLTVSIYAQNASGMPTGAVLVNGSINFASINNADESPVNITMITKTLLSPGGKYVIVPSGDRGVSFATRNTDVYLGYGLVSNTGGGWSFEFNRDAYFELIGFINGTRVSSVNSNAFNITTYQTAAERFVTNITTDGASLSSANFVFNGTEYAASVSGNSPTYILSYSTDSPNIVGTVNWFWNLSYSDSSYDQVSGFTQTVSLLNLSICGSAPQNTPYINFTFKNESTLQENMGATITSSWTYYLGSGSVTKSYSYSNAAESQSYAFCNTPINRTVYATPTITYAANGYPQRSYSPGQLRLTSSTTNTTLFLLDSSSGSYVTFQVINAALQPLSGVVINISSSGSQIEAKTTDSSGGATFFLNPYNSYTLIASKSGYPTLTTSVTPTQSTYTLTLGTGATANSSSIDYTQGITYLISPKITYLSNRTTYTFNVTLESTYWDVSSFGFTLRNASGSVFKTASSSTNGGTVSTTMSTADNSTIVMDFYYIINATQTNYTTSWQIFDDSGTEWSIKNTATNIRSYLTQGIFGITPFALNIIVFLTIFFFTGVISYKFSFTSPGAVLGIMFGLTFLFDIGLGLITYSSRFPAYNSHPATWVLLLLTIVFVVKESYS